MKQHLVSLARTLHLLPLLEHSRFAWLAARTRAGNMAYLGEHPGFAAPPARLMHDMYAHTDLRLYADTGRAYARAIAAMIDRHVDSAEPEVAEWGCGLARILRHLPAHYRITGFDLNGEAIAWCRRTIANVAFFDNGLMPPLPAESARFDAVYSISVFTHLSEAAHHAWVEELERVLVPGGVLIASFHGPAQSGGLLPGERARFDGGALVVCDGVREGSRTFVAYHPDAFVRALLEKRLSILDGPLQAVGQTVWIARRKDDREGVADVRSLHDYHDKTPGRGESA